MTYAQLQQQLMPTLSAMLAYKNGMNFDPESADYDQLNFDKYGNVPTYNAEDGRLHGQSRVGETGLLLKGKKHKTWDLLMQGEKEAGYQVQKMRDGRYYSFPVPTMMLKDQLAGQ